MIVKGPLSELKNLLYSEQSLDFETEYQQYIQKGVNAVVFGMRILEQEEAELLVKHITELQNNNRDEFFITNELLMWANELNCIGILGLKRHGNLRKSLVLEEAFKNDVKVWIVTDEDEAQTLTECN